jgi:hypothetical protein
MLSYIRLGCIGPEASVPTDESTRSQKPRKTAPSLLFPLLCVWSGDYEFRDWDSKPFVLLSKAVVLPAAIIFDVGWESHFIILEERNKLLPMAVFCKQATSPVRRSLSTRMHDGTPQSTWASPYSTQLQPWKWSYYVCPKRRHPPPSLHDSRTQNNINILTTVKTSNLTIFMPFMQKHFILFIVVGVLVLCILICLWIP